MEDTRIFREGGLLSKALSFKNSENLITIESLNSNIFLIYKAISNKINSKKSILLFLNKKNYFVPLYSDGFSFETFNRIRLKEDSKQENLKKRFVQLTSVLDKTENPLFVFKFVIHNSKFIFVSNSYDNNYSFDTDYFKNLIEDTSINNIDLKLEEHFQHKPKHLTVTYIKISYNENISLNDLIEKEVLYYKTLCSIFPTSYISRHDLGKLTIFSEYEIYPETLSFELHVKSILNDIKGDDSCFSIKTVLSDSDYVSLEKLSNYKLDEF